MLSVRARKLYQRLFQSVAPQRDDLDPEAKEDQAAHELAAAGLLDMSGPVLKVAPPRSARYNLAVGANQRARQLLADAVEVDAFLAALVPARTGSTQDDELVVVLHEKTEVFHLSAAIQSEARRESMSVNTMEFESTAPSKLFIGPRRGEPKPLLGHEVHTRVIYSPSYPADTAFRAQMLAAVEDGEDARIHPNPPLKFKIVDRVAALVPLDATGAGGAILIRSPAVCGMLVDYFEKLWAEAKPFPEARKRYHDRPLMPTQHRVLELLAADHIDAEIARRLGISERTVRRHIGGILDTLGVHTRHGAVHAANKRGMLD